MSSAQALPETEIGPSRVWSLRNCQELWEYRELLFFFTLRNFQARYRQTILGVGWAVLRPLITVIVFTAVFSKLARVPTGETPYIVFALSGLLAWNFFSSGLLGAADGLVGQAGIIKKVYFPRIIIPITANLNGLVDFAIGLVLLLAVMAREGMTPSWRLVLLPAFVCLAFVISLGGGLWLSAMNVKYRDVSYAAPTLVQLWLFASPVAYPRSLVPDKWQFIYALNPMAGVIDGFRWVILPSGFPFPTYFSLSCLVAFLLLVGGVLYFLRAERDFADVV